MSSQSPQQSSTRLRSGLLALAAALCIPACGEEPGERYQKLVEAIEMDDFDTFTSYLTLESNAALRDTLEAARRSRIVYINDWKRLAPRGEVLDFEVEGQVAFLKVQQSRGTQEVRMLLENDNWHLDLYGLPSFWAPLQGNR